MAEGESANSQGDNNLVAGEKMSENEIKVGESQLTAEELRKQKQKEADRAYYLKHREEKILKTREYYANKTADKVKQKPGRKRMELSINTPVQE